MVEAWADPELRQAARAALKKVEAVLPDEHRQKLHDTSLFALNRPFAIHASRWLGPLRQVIQARNVVELEYEDEVRLGTTRRVRPLGLFFWGKRWTLGAWCELRADHRNFRVDRINGLQTLPSTFADEAPWTLDAFLESAKRR